MSKRIDNPVSNRICEIWFGDLQDEFRGISEQAEHDNLIVFARLMPIENYELGRQMFLEYQMYYNCFFKELANDNK